MTARTAYPCLLALVVAACGGGGGGGTPTPVTEPPPTASKVQLEILEGEEDLTVTLGQNSTVAFAVQVTNPDGEPLQLDLTESVTPATGLSTASDKPAGGWATTATEQAYLVQYTLSGSAVGEYELALAGSATANGQGVAGERTVVVRVIPPGGIGYFSLTASPSGLQTGTTAEIFFGAKHFAFEQLPTSVVLDEVTAGGNFIRTLGTMLDTGQDPDLNANDEIYSLTASIPAPQAPGALYFRVTYGFPDGSSFTSPIEALPVLPYPVGLVPGEEQFIEFDEQTDTNFYCDQVLVAFRGDTTTAEIDAAVASINGSVLGAEPALSVLQLAIPCTGPEGVGNAIATLLQNPAVESAEPNILSPTSLEPNDGEYGGQWAPLQIGLEEAWLLRGTSSPPVIAVIDSGVDYNHEDLRGWITRRARCPDNWGGVTVLQKLCTGVASQLKIRKGKDFISGDNDPMDQDYGPPDAVTGERAPHGHGTHVAGIAAAFGNNGVGVAGAAWDSPVLAIRACRNGYQWILNKEIGKRERRWNCWFDTSVTVSAITYATPRAKVINMSFGGNASAFCLIFCGGFEPSPVLLRSMALDYAVKKGVLPVAAAGNDSTSKPNYPCAYSSVLCVGSTAPGDNRSSFSNFGSHVDVAAPGSNILSTFLLGGYESWNGTSMATPLVAGVAALVWAQNPGLSVKAVRTRLAKTGAALPGQQIGPRIDAFGAAFNGSLEAGLGGWRVAGTGSTATALGKVTPTHGRQMAMASTGPNDSVTQTTMTRTFTVRDDIGDLEIRFDYAMLTEEYPEYVGGGYNDSLSVEVTTACSVGTTTLVSADVDTAPLVPIDGINFPDGDDTMGWTGWSPVRAVIPIQQCDFYSDTVTITLTVVVTDVGDGTYDTVGLIDNIRLDDIPTDAGNSTEGMTL